MSGNQNKGCTNYVDWQKITFLIMLYFANTRLRWNNEDAKITYRQGFVFFFKVWDFVLSIPKNRLWWIGGSALKGCHRKQFDVSEYVHIYCIYWLIYLFGFWVYITVARYWHVNKIWFYPYWSGTFVLMYALDRAFRTITLF